MSKDNNGNNIPIYKIHGIERRKLKKDLSLLNLMIKNFWYHYQLNQDLCKLFNCDSSWIMDNDAAQLKYEELCLKSELIKKELSELYII